jgi:hypothetical protein
MGWTEEHRNMRWKAVRKGITIKTSFLSNSPKISINDNSDNIKYLQIQMELTFLLAMNKLLTNSMELSTTREAPSC